MVNALVIAICSILMLVGLFGVILPFVPGVPLVWLGLFIYAIYTGFDQISILAVVIFFILTLVSFGLDLAGTLLGLKKYSASWYSILGAFLGFIIGLLVFGFWGVILGPLVGAFIGEIVARGDLRQGLRAAFGGLIGSIVGTLIKIIIALIMIGYFIFSFF